MKYKITLQQLLNLTAAIEFMLTLTPAHILRGMNAWVLDPSKPLSTKNPACFGGWVPRIPHFAALGVTSNPDVGNPRVGSEVYSADVSQELFGARWLFARQMSDFHGKQFNIEDRRRWRSMPNPTDYDLILLRLAHVIDNAEVRET